jgi:hypothetical protein
MLQIESPNPNKAPDLRKVRRRIEDRLRKDDEAVKAAAYLLKIKQD